MTGELFCCFASDLNSAPALLLALQVVASWPLRRLSNLGRSCREESEVSSSMHFCKADCRACDQEILIGGSSCSLPWQYQGACCAKSSGFYIDELLMIALALKILKKL